MNTGLDPFIDARGEKFYFITPALRQRIDLLRHLVEFGRQIIMLIGASGAGKSALLERVTEPLEKNWRVLRFDADPALSRSALLTKIASELAANDPDGNDDVLIDEIRRRVKAASQRGETTVLAIDDAHTLPVDTHICLAGLAHAVDEAAEMKVVLSADPVHSPLLGPLQSETSEHALVHVVEIPRLNDEQTRAMLMFRWNACDGNDKIPLTATQMSRIYQRSNGNPGKALVLARQERRLTSSPQQSVRGPVQRYLIGGAAMIVVFLVFALFNAGDPDDKPQTSVKIELPELTTLTTVQPTAIWAQSKHSPRTLSGAPDSERLETTTPATQSVTLNSPSDSPPPMATPPAAGRSPPSVKAVISMPLTMPPPTPTGAALAQPEPAAPDLRSVPLGVPGVPKLEAAPPAGKPKNPDRYAIDWLRTQPGAGYVLQLFGVRDRRAAVAFIEAREIGDKSTVWTSKHEGAPWYVVVYGNYPDRAAATAAIADLPANLAITKPWPRPIASLE